MVLIASLAFNTKGLEHYRSFEEKGIPLIFFDRVEEKSDSTKVIIDNYKCGYQATQHLIEQGCKKIVLVTANLKRNVYAQRHKGYTDALFDNSIPFEKDLVLIKDLSEQCGVEAAMQILKMKPLPDGAFITNDFSAAVCMQTLKEHGVRIPEDIAIVGFNNDAISKIVEPQLTTIHYPGIDMGEIAARNLINHLRGISNIRHTQTIVVRSELIIRKSSLKKQNPYLKHFISNSKKINCYYSFYCWHHFNCWQKMVMIYGFVIKQSTMKSCLASYRNTISGINITANSPTLLAAKEELENGLKGLLGKNIPVTKFIAEWC